MQRCLVFAGACLALTSLPLSAAVVGQNQRAESLTPQRIALLPKKSQPAWTAYLRRSALQQKADRAALTAERKRLKEIPPMPQESGGTRSMPLDKDDDWYASTEAQHIADTIVSFQTPAGGWGKNIDMSGPVRQRGQSYVANNLSHYLDPTDFDTPSDPQWNYVGTLDNDAAITEMRFLAKVAAAPHVPVRARARYRASFLRGIHYLLAAQYPNGGWPQVWPLEGHYHDAITFNDDAVIEVTSLLTDAAAGKGLYSFVPPAVRAQARSSTAKALGCILQSQFVFNGHRTIWPQQEDPITLAPTSARNYEPPALATGESTRILLYLMALPTPSADVQQAIRDGIDWMKSARLYDVVWTSDKHAPGNDHTPPGRILAYQAGAGPLWARFYSISTGHPIFGDRDKSIHNEVNEISLERRNGYSWYSKGPEKALDRYSTRMTDHPVPTASAPASHPADGGTGTTGHPGTRRGRSRT